MSKADSYTSQEWQTLQFAPFWVFFAVAGADGKIDKKEMSALATELAEASLYNDPLVSEVLTSVGDDLSNLMDLYLKDSRSWMSGLGEVQNVLENNATSKQANSFKKSMLIIGHRIAEASGGWFFRDPVCDEEKRAIVMIAATLGVKL